MLCPTVCKYHWSLFFKNKQETNKKKLIGTSAFLKNTISISNDETYVLLLKCPLFFHPKEKNLRKFKAAQDGI